MFFFLQKSHPLSRLLLLLLPGCFPIIHVMRMFHGSWGILCKCPVCLNITVKYQTSAPSKFRDYQIKIERGPLLGPEKTFKTAAAKILNFYQMGGGA
uniref:Putative secreted protein n=1 Tax=Ixodes ricinus TaxID=34613 RepID=A0A6B0UI14_IXORI